MACAPSCMCLCVHRRTDGRIPLKDLIRFKERQWFVEELEVGGGGNEEGGRDGSSRGAHNSGDIALSWTGCALHRQ